MPLPKPDENENQDDWMSRCMSNPTMNEEYSDDEQRYAVCISLWENKDMSKKIKYFSNPAKSVDEDKRVLRFIGSTEDKDRDEEVIKASGWKLKNYKKNPVVLVNHQYHELPVAKTKNVWVENKKLLFDIEFPDSDVNPQGDTLYKLYKNGYMNSTSVGFLPDFDKIKYGEKKGEPRATYNGQELLEISLVSVPANPQAIMTSKSVMKAVEDEVIDELERKDLELYLQKIFENVDKNDDSSINNKQNEEKVAEEKETPDTQEKHSEVHKYICSCCGKEIEPLCSKCIEEKEQEEFFKKIYEAILFDKK